jgi:hypothetical protein
MENLMDFFIKQEKQRRINNYDAAWKIFLESIEVAAQAKMKLPSVVETILEHNGKYDGFIPKFLADQVHAIDYGSRFAHVPAPYRLNVLDGTYVSVPRELSNIRFFDAIADHIDSDVDCLVEFGSGTGLNLARMRLRLPEANLCYMACEPSENGRMAAETLFSLDPEARLRTQYFDYLDTDLSFLKDFRKVVAFTCHSIEQILILGDGFYERLLNSNIHACIHCEPIGWQRSAECYDAAINLLQNLEYRRQFMQSCTFVLTNKDLLANAATWASLGGYNTDLLQQISGAADRGDITIESTAYDFVGSNPFNPSTLISWVRRLN